MFDKTKTMTIDIPTNEDGFIGRHCPKCKKYFKVKLGTGLPTSQCNCPYCAYSGNSNNFTTPDQNRYIESIIKKEIQENYISPVFNKIASRLKDLERKTKGNFIQIKSSVKREPPYIPIRTYREKELETYLTCDNCKLDFAIYGVFARCPDCQKLNAYVIFKKSIEASKKILELNEQFASSKEIIESNHKIVLNNAVSSFDALGKFLRTKYPNLFPEKPKNLFQNINELNKVLSTNLNLRVSDNSEDFSFLLKMFQVRHIYEHNMGVIDSYFVQKVIGYDKIEGRKYQLNKEELKKLLFLLLEMVEKIELIIKQSYSNKKINLLYTFLT